MYSWSWNGYFIHLSVNWLSDGGSRWHPSPYYVWLQCTASRKWHPHAPCSWWWVCFCIPAQSGGHDCTVCTIGHTLGTLSFAPALAHCTHALFFHSMCKFHPWTWLLAPCWECICVLGWQKMCGRALSTSLASTNLKFVLVSCPDSCYSTDPVLYPGPPTHSTAHLIASHQCNWPLLCILCME